MNAVPVCQYCLVLFLILSLAFAYGCSRNRETKTADSTTDANSADWLSKKQKSNKDIPGGNYDTKYPYRSAYNVLERVDYKNTYKSDIKSELFHCTLEYEQFVNKASSAGHGKAISRKDLQRKINDYRLIPEKNIYPGSLTKKELKNHLIEAVNLGFLLEGINGRPLKTTVISYNSNPDLRYDQVELLFEDPWVGKFKATWLKTTHKFPKGGIIALHGHETRNEQDFINKFFGSEYPKRGYDLILPMQRPLCFKEKNSGDFFTYLLSHGFSMLQIRAYEVLLIAKFLKYHGVENIGLIGHSGGSTFANFTVRIAPQVFAAHISDYLQDYYLTFGSHDMLTDTSHPDVFRYCELINDLSTTGISLEAPYGYADNAAGKSFMPQTFEFLDKHLIEK